MTNLRHPLTMESKPTGEHFRFEKSSRASGKLEFEWTLAPGKRGPGEHVHPTETETFRVISGTLRIWLDGAPHDVGPGQVIAAAPGVRHRFLNPGPEPMVAAVTCDGTRMEDALVPVAVYFNGRTKPTLPELMRMMVHFASADGSVPTSRIARGLLRLIARIGTLFGARAFDVVEDWQERADVGARPIA